MSVFMMARMFKIELGSSSRKIMAVRLADFADDEGRGIWPTVARLSRETELSERTVQRILADFVAEGLLVVVSEASGRPGQATRYDFDLATVRRLETAPRPVAASQTTGDTMSPVATGDMVDETGVMVSETGDTDDRDGCHHVTRTVIEPPVKPSLKPSSRERARASAGEGADAEAFADDEGETVLEIERGFWRLVKDWPGLGGMPKQNHLKAWAALTREERQAAAAAFPRWLALLKANRKTCVPAPSTYFAEKLWLEVPAEEARAADAAKPCAPFGKAWMAERLALLCARPTGAIPGMTAFERAQVDQGKTTAEAVWREKRMRFGWPAVNEMGKRAADGRGTVVPGDLKAIADDFQQVSTQGALWEAWAREHARRGWPWLADARPPEWVWMPKVLDDWRGDPDGAVRAAIDGFQVAVKGIRGDADAA